MRDDVIFLGEQPCPKPYAGSRVPIYRVIRKDHPKFGQILTEQQVLLNGLYSFGLAQPNRDKSRGFTALNSENP
jgi:hypothetical protein